MNIDFTGQTVLVTGATRGIGKAIADELQVAGANLILTGANPSRVKALNEDCQRNGVSNVRYERVDFDDDGSLDSFLERLENEARIDACINNAGINRINPIGETLREDLDMVYRVNLRAPHLVCQAVSKVMKRQHYGRIVNIASIWSVITKPQRSVYTATKFGLVGLTKTVAVDLAPYNILANAVSPGFVLTDMTRTMLSNEERDRLAAQVPIGRFAEPSEIAKIVLFLASNVNTYITAQNIVADGGFVSV